MKIRKTRLACVLAIAALSSASIANADGFLGLGAGFTDTSANGFKDSTGARAYGGYLFSEQYGLEVGYIDFGEFDVKNAAPGNFAEVTGAYVALSGANRISPTTELTGKLGVFHYEFERASRGIVVARDDGTRPMLSIGANFYLTPNMALGIDFTHVNDVEDENIDSLWLQLHVRFGGS